MKKMRIIALSALFAAVSLIACNSGRPSTPAQEASAPAHTASEVPAQSGTEIAEAERAHKSLVVYFSHPETDDPLNMTRAQENSTVVIDGKVLGNTQYAALLIQEYTGSDIFRIEPVNPYPLDYSVAVSQAAEEQRNNARPAIAGRVNTADYDTIFLGYPTWWMDLPMVVYTFLEDYDLSGKTIIPFNTHGGSGFSDTINTIARLEPNATVVTEGLSISRDKVADSKADIAAWLTKIGYMQAD